jgi:hypothetical protein
MRSCVLGALACILTLMLIYLYHSNIGSMQSMTPLGDTLTHTHTSPHIASPHPRTITGFYHIAMTGQWQPIIKDQLRQLQESGVLNATDRLHTVVLQHLVGFLTPPISRPRGPNRRGPLRGQWGRVRKLEILEFKTWRWLK